MSLDEEYHTSRKRAGGRCEWVEEHKYKKDIRCDEVQGERAKHYKGNCILLPNIRRSKLTQAIDIRWLCFRHSNDMDNLEKRKSTPKVKPSDQKQINLFPSE